MTKGRWGFTSGLKYCFLRREDGSTENRVMVSVPKRLFKRAVKRNLLKRRLRESYRVRKDLVQGTDILFLYNSKEILDSKEIARQVEQILKNIGQ